MVARPTGYGFYLVKGKPVFTDNLLGLERFRWEAPQALAMPFDETFDVGVDTRTGVNDADYHVPFRFTGTIEKLTVKHGPEQFTSDDPQIIQHALAKARD